MLLHSCVLLRQLEEAAASTWTSIATTELARAERHHTTLGVLMIDIDHFKRINDHHGHHVGDQVLQLIANVLRGGVRPYDIVARFGGEEFVVLCPDLTATDLVAVGERLRTTIRETTVPLTTAADELRTSVSIGAALYPDNGPALDDLLRAADVALFAAKDSGRDRVRSVVNNFDA